eukprot:scaffold16159_cov125-Skeletonema_dohrnii-CCMP3373.AAC.3
MHMTTPTKAPASSKLGHEAAKKSMHDRLLSSVNEDDDKWRCFGKPLSSSIEASLHRSKKGVGK